MPCDLLRPSTSLSFSFLSPFYPAVNPRKIIWVRNITVDTSKRLLFQEDQANLPPSSRFLPSSSWAPPGARTELSDSQICPELSYSWVKPFPSPPFLQVSTHLPLKAPAKRRWFSSFWSIGGAGRLKSGVGNGAIYPSGKSIRRLHQMVTSYEEVPHL